MTDLREPKAGELWRHQNGHVYRVVCLSVDEGTHDVRVVYEPLNDEHRPSPAIAAWSRTLDSWLSPKDGRPRFTLVAEAEAIGKATSEQQGCTGSAAVWCPKCGDCKCRTFDTGERSFSDDACPLHGRYSHHGDDDVSNLKEMGR